MFLQLSPVGKEPLCGGVYGSVTARQRAEYSLGVGEDLMLRETGAALYRVKEKL